MDEQTLSLPNCLDFWGNFKSESQNSHHNSLHNNVKYSFFPAQDCSNILEKFAFTSEKLYMQNSS